MSGHAQPGTASPHVHDGVDHCHLPLKYTDYIQSHLNTLKENCSHFTACINKLLSEESPLLVLKGGNISLNKTCGLIFKNNSSDYITLSGKCTGQAREDIKHDIEHHLEDAIQESSWKSVRKCLQNNYGDSERTTYTKDLCGLAHDQQVLCKSHNTHKLVETFFNEQIQHLKCTCQNLTAASDDHSHFPMSALIGAGIGGFVFLIIICAIFFCCYRRRKAKKKKKRSPNVIYLPAQHSDNHPVYQELYDDKYHGMRPNQMSPSNNPPTLPSRYTTPSRMARMQEEEPTYLEPIEADPMFRQRMAVPVSNRGYGAPPKYSEKAEDSPDAPCLPEADSENGYFEPLPSPSKEDTLGPTTMAPDIPSGDPDQPLGPVPAKRTKKEDRNVESHYYVLEKEKEKEKEEDV